MAWDHGFTPSQAAPRAMDRPMRLVCRLACTIHSRMVSVPLARWTICPSAMVLSMGQTLSQSLLSWFNPFDLSSRDAKNRPPQS